jgi:hypothetical protein
MEIYQLKELALRNERLIASRHSLACVRVRRHFVNIYSLIVVFYKTAPKRARSGILFAFP